MAILAIITGPVSKEQYEILRRETNWEGNQPDGGVFHAASFDDAGYIHAADIWESEQALNTFFETRLLPNMQKLQLDPPGIAIYPIHNVNAFDAIDKHKV